MAIAAVVFAACGPSSNETQGLVSIEVQPANATITLPSGVMPVDYTAIGHYKDGHTHVLSDATFALDTSASALGTLSVAEFNATGAAAGTGNVIATDGMATGSTTVNVVIHNVHVDPTAPPDAANDFPDTSPMGAQSPVIDYPLDGAVMPATVKAPDVQWEGANTAADLYRVRLVAGLATVDTILAGGPTFKLDSAPLAADWQLLIASSGGQPITVQVDHWDATNGAQGGAPVHVRTVAANVTGAIYYWNLSQGRMERIDANGRGLAIPNPPASPSDANNHCVACHVVSRDGRYMSGELWGGGLQGAVFDLSDPAVQMGNPAPTLAPVTSTSYTSLFSTFNPDATRLLINPGTQLQLIDPHTGAAVATQGTPLPTANAAHPCWSPDGTSIVYVANILANGAAAGWAVDYTSGDLAVIPVTGPDTFGASATIVPSASVDPAFAAPSWPSFAPDSSWIAYGAGVNSRGRNSVNNVETTLPGSLFLVQKTGGTPTRLDIACSGARNCFLPNFSPYDDGGYFWLVFYSLRDYGNPLAGTKGTTRRQMWVTAIDKSKLGTADASSVPYWIPDQDTTTENMSAFWALPPPLQ
ncbi:MAG: PD40 domain-containing protein [Deltaproteobacteria bacterium]|nr:PD40 domain-containing protein [Deltaproteobacteria bacterium]